MYRFSVSGHIDFLLEITVNEVCRAKLDSIPHPRTTRGGMNGDFLLVILFAILIQIINRRMGREIQETINIRR